MVDLPTLSLVGNSDPMDLMENIKEKSHFLKWGVFLKLGVWIHPFIQKIPTLWTLCAQASFQILGLHQWIKNCNIIKLPAYRLIYSLGGAPHGKTSRGEWITFSIPGLAQVWVGLTLPVQSSHFTHTQSVRDLWFSSRETTAQGHCYTGWEHTVLLYSVY